MRVKKTTLTALCLMMFVSVIAFAAAGDRYFSNPTSNKDVVIQVNRSGTMTDVIKTTGSTGVVTIGPTTGAVGHVIQGGNTQLNVRSENAATSAYITFAQSGGSQSAIVGACAAGSLIIDAAAGDMCLRTGNDIRFSTNSGGSSQGRVSGSVWYNAAGTWTVSSDRRLKKNIVTMEGALDRINALHPVTFDWIEDKPAVSKPRAGFIAQEVEQVMPSVVRRSPYTYKFDGKEVLVKDAQHLDLGSEMFANLVQAIQELSAENEALKFRLTALESDRKY